MGDMKCVLDTDVIVAALRSSMGASRQILTLLAQEKISVVASVSIMLEYEAVLKRPENLLAAALTAPEIDLFLDGLAILVTPVSHFYLWRPQLQDPGDEHILEAAVNGQVDTIVTFNLRHLKLAAQRFGIDVLRPSEALRRIRS